MNILSLFLIAFIPIVIGAIYYHPKVVGTRWMKANNFTNEDLKGANMIIILGVSYLVSLGITFYLKYNCINSTTCTDGEGQMCLFFYGLQSGVFLATFIVAPIIVINALFERRSITYMLVHIGYWFISLCLMSLIICLTS